MLIFTIQCSDIIVLCGCHVALLHPFTSPSPPWQRRSHRPSTPEAGTSPPEDRPHHYTQGGCGTGGNAPGSPLLSGSPAGGWATNSLLPEGQKQRVSFQQTESPLNLTLSLYSGRKPQEAGREAALTCKLHRKVPAGREFKPNTLRQC